MYKKIVAFLCALSLLLPIGIHASDDLYLGGDSIGIQLDYNGVMITGTYPFVVQGETYDPGGTIQPSDILVKVNQVPISSMDELYQQLSAFQEAVNEIPVEIRRGSNTIPVTLKTTYDASTRSFKSGLYVKDKIVGVGTLTYYDPSNNTYGALGHEIMDSDLKQIAEVPSGSLYPANVISITKAQDNIPGEKHAEIDFSSAFANVLANTNIGIYGHYDSMLRNVKALPWAKHDEVHTGKAVMYTVLQGNTIEPFTINITKVHRQNTSDVKGIEFTIADECLASASNGIVQGMSGSPIVQDGKIIGAVTHVITSHPSNGYGVFVEWMLEKSRNMA